MADEKEEEKKKLEEKKEEKPWYQQIPPIILIGVAILVYFAFKSMMMPEAEQGQQFILILTIMAVMYILSQRKKEKEEIVTPKEAELLVEREFERKKRWNQFSLMSHYNILPINNIIHKSARGMYYDIPVIVNEPFDRPYFYSAKVMMSGPERGFVSVQDSISRKRDAPQIEQMIEIPPWLKTLRNEPILEKLFLK